MLILMFICLKLVTGLNSLCVDGFCDCIRDGIGVCIAYPPESCTPGEQGDCEGALVCDPSSQSCTIPDIDEDISTGIFLYRLQWLIG